MLKLHACNILDMFLLVSVRYLLSCDASRKSDLNNLSIEDHWLEWDVLHLQVLY